MKISKNEQKILNYCEAHDISKMKIDELAANTFTVPSAVSKLSKKMGFSSYHEFRKSRSKFLKQNEVMELGEFSSYYLNAILKSISSIEQSCADEFCQDIIDASDIILFGLGSSFLSAKYLSSNLFRLGISNFLDEDFYITNRLMKIKPNALVILFSNSGVTKEVLESVKETNNKLIVITSNAEAPICERASLVVNYKEVGLSKSNFSNVSMTIQVFLIDLILNQLCTAVEGNSKFNSQM